MSQEPPEDYRSDHIAILVIVLVALAIAGIMALVS